MDSGIYKITNPEGQVYIGQSSCLKKRLNRYNKITGGLLSQRKIKESIIKHGIENHKIEIIEYCEKSILLEREEFHIQSYGLFNTDKSLNLNSGGRNPRLSDDSRNYMSQSVRNRPESVIEYCKKRSSETHTGNNYRLGKKHSRESKEKISISRSGGTISEEHKASIIRANTGRVHTKESRDLMSKNCPKKKILNTETGEVFFGYKKVSELTGIKRTTLIAQLTGQNKNSTKFQLI